MRKLIAGNWKMHGSLASARALARDVRAGATGLAAELLVCPPVVHLAGVAGELIGGPVAFGGQDCHQAASGAHTGDVSAPMLAELGATYVILGHSERRAAYQESDALVRAKAVAAAAAGLTPILCVGEDEADRLAGRALSQVSAQLAASLPPGFTGAIAYEPIWAIGTGRTPGEAEIVEMHAAIRATLRAELGADGAGVRILYGGSVKPSNAAALLSLPEVGGALIGGASLQAADFLAIAAAA